MISLFKLGNLTRYISESVIIGFMAAAAFLLAAGQLGNALGVRDKGNGHMQVLRRVWLTLTHGDAINYRALTLSVAAVVLAVVLRKLVQRYGWPQIDMLAVLVSTAVIAYLAGWSVPGANGHTAVAVAAKIPRSLPTPHIAEVHASWLPELSTGALAIAFVGIIEALSIAKAIAYQTKQEIDYNRQIMAEGLANLAGGLSRACRARVRSRDRRSTSNRARGPGSPGSSRPQPWPRRCCCSHLYCVMCPRRRWPDYCSSRPRGSSTSGA